MHACGVCPLPTAPQPCCVANLYVDLHDMDLLDLQIECFLALFPFLTAIFLLANHCRAVCSRLLIWENVSE